MYIVKLDLSVKGLPASVTRGCTRHIAKSYDVDSPFIAIDKAQSFCYSPRYVSAVENLYSAVLCAILYDHVPATGDVIMNARYTVFDCDDNKCVATYVRHFNFDDFDDDDVY